MRNIIILFLIMSFTAISCNKHEEQNIIKKFDHDTDGMLSKNGKRTFIIGIYHLPKGENP